MSLRVSSARSTALGGEVPLAEMNCHSGPAPDKSVTVESSEQVCGPPALPLPPRPAMLGALRLPASRAFWGFCLDYTSLSLL